jgi:ArsR family transcriptional regulator, arsenate/arsenite/antimonite-responsive transcriptional repressor
MDAKKFEKISKALSDPHRLMILKEIKKKKQNCLYCVDLYDKTHLAQPSVSHHIKLLADADLITTEKEGRNMKYSLNNQVFDEYINYLQTLRA